MRRRLINLLISLDQFLYCLVTLGHSDPDVTLSADAWRWEQHKRPVLKCLRPIIDRLFWFDPNHCEKSFESEVRIEVVSRKIFDQ